MTWITFFIIFAVLFCFGIDRRVHKLEKKVEELEKKISENTRYATEVLKENMDTYRELLEGLMDKKGKPTKNPK